MKTMSCRFLRLLLAALFLSMFSAGIVWADYAYYFPYFSSSASKGELIGLHLANTDGARAKIKIAILDQDGVILKVEQWTLAPHGQRAAVLGTDLNEVEGSFQVVSTRPLTGFAFLFANHMQVMYDMAMTQKPLNVLDIPQVAQTEEWGMRVFVNNPGDKAVTVSLRYQAGDGSRPTAAYRVALKAYASAVINLADLLDDWRLSELAGGCLHLTSDGAGITAFASYDSLGSGGTFYAGIAAIDPSLQMDNFIPSRSQYAVVSCSAPDFGSGAHALIDVEKPRLVQENLLPTISDIKMAARGEFFYRIARYNGDSVTKFAAAAPAQPIWQYSTMDDSDAMATSNPQSLIFATDNKAYIPRFQSTKMWVVNPSTTDESGFKLGTVDLSAYADADGLPEMTQGVVVGDKLFLLVQRLDQDNGWLPQTPYLVVIDTNTNQEIDTKSAGSANLKGIPLPVKNPWNIVYKNGKIYINGAGSYANSWSGTPADYSGGIVAVDPASYEVTTLVDDGDAENHPYGNISGLTVVSAAKGYFISYLGWGDNVLYSFNPTTGAVAEAPLASFPGETKTNISALGVDNAGMVWVCSNTAKGGGSITIINPADDSIDQVQKLTLNPQGVAFGSWE